MTESTFKNLFTYDFEMYQSNDSMMSCCYNDRFNLFIIDLNGKKYALKTYKAFVTKKQSFISKFKFNQF